MLRTVALIFCNEFRLFAADRAALFMIFLAPVVIIAVAGFSLGNLFGAATADRRYLVPIVDRDHGALAKAIVKALGHESSIEIVDVADLKRARAMVMGRERAPLAIEIPAGTTAAFESGQIATLRVYVDPVKRLQASAIELRLNDLSHALAAAARKQALEELSKRTAELRAQLEHLSSQAQAVRDQLEDYRRKAERARTEIRRVVQARLRRALAELEARTQMVLDQAVALTRVRLEGGLAKRRDAIAAVSRYLGELHASEREFDRWFAELKAAAGSHAGEIPPPPGWPEPPSRQQLAVLEQPLQIAIAKPALPAPAVPLGFGDALPALTPPPAPKLQFEVPALRPGAASALPGDIGWRDRSLSPSHVQVNAFDQYVPGFGVTFLLIDMLWGMSVGLMDERQWGTLERLRASGAPVAGMMMGKIGARFVIGFIQMVVLFAAGWLLFGITLSESPAMLALPSAAIAFAAAAFGLVIAGVAPSRDSVLPIGSVAAMAMSAIGGCWWPLGFEPSWMRGLALAMPTTWAMRAFNNVMIRGLEPSSALVPAAFTFSLGLVFLAAGVIRSARLYD